VLRAPYLGQGAHDLAAALERARSGVGGGKMRLRAVRTLRPEDWTAAGDLIANLARALQPLEELFASPGKVGLQALVRAHVAAGEALSKGEDGADDGVLWQGEAGEEACKFLAQLLDRETPAPDMSAGEYPDFYRGLAAELTIREREGPIAHPRISIWEPYESRLQQPDIVILGSLNEGTWPRAPDPGPWLNRQMRQQLGMPALEERIGDASHIFTSLLGAERVYLTRAVKIAGVPTVPSRWLQRLEALLTAVDADVEADQPWLAWAQARNTVAGPVRPAPPPAPRPPVAMRPRRLSATAVEKWIANPYAIFAAHILCLHPLPPLGRQPDGALRGQIVHEALGRFAERFPGRLPDDAQAELNACAEAALVKLTASPRVAAFWGPRFARFAAWFAETEPARRAAVAASLAEVDGSLELGGPAGPFTLTARADRIDVGAGGLVITDYKTGARIKELAARATQGLEPQLPLEAAVAAAGGFAGLAACRVQGLRYISASGGEPPGQECSLQGQEADLAVLAQQARDGLDRLIATFDLASTPYRALRRPRFTYRFDDFAHLARVAEWSAEASEEA
jgi:ATP-dependent helicase/nuclease subunit B